MKVPLSSMCSPKVLLVVVFWLASGLGGCGTRSESPSVEGTVTLAPALVPGSSDSHLIVAIYKEADFDAAKKLPKQGTKPVFKTVLPDLKNPPFVFTIPTAVILDRVYLVAWIDQDGSGDVLPTPGDLYGQYTGNPFSLSKHRLSGLSVELDRKL